MKCIPPIDNVSNMVICEVSHQWEAERLRLRSLPPEVHEVMWVNLGQGEVLCQVLRIGHSDPAYAEHCRIVVPPHHVKLKPGEERKTYNRVRMKYLRRRVAEGMPRSWSEWLADLLGLDGGGPEVGLGGRDGGRAGLTRGERPGPSESRHGARVTLRRRSASFLDSVPTRRSPPLTPPLPSSRLRPSPTTAPQVTKRRKFMLEALRSGPSDTGPRMGPARSKARVAVAGEEVVVEFPVRPLPWKEGRGSMKGRPLALVEEGGHGES